jgi:hypothetical protein
VNGRSAQERPERERERERERRSSNRNLIYEGKSKSKGTFEKSIFIVNIQKWN